MVRFKNRYFVIQFDREKDLFDDATKAKHFKPRACQDSKPLDIPARDMQREKAALQKDMVLADAVKHTVEHLHGDFGRAVITTGFKTIYCNPETHLALIRCRHGPHRLVGSSLPFLTKLDKEKVVPKLIYTGATIKHCYKRIKVYQRKNLEIALKELEDIDETEKKAIKEQLMITRAMKY